MEFADAVTNMLSLVALIDMMKPNPANWPVFQVKPLPRLTSKSGKFLLMGDAAHAMAFYLSLGVFTSTLSKLPVTERQRCLNGR
jgi:salicylate hydroxylase